MRGNLVSLFFTFLWVVISTGINAMITITSKGSQQSSCGSWIPYGNEKCIHIVDSAVFQTKAEAGVVCQSLTEIMELDDIPRLVTVRTEAEQMDLQRILFEELGLLEPIWLGLDREDDGVTRWNNGAEMHFNNLAKQNVSAADRPCVQMESGQGVYQMGQWVRVNCRKRNVVVCEKIQVWATAKLQREFLNLKSKVEMSAQNEDKLSGKKDASHDKSPSIARTAACLWLYEEPPTCPDKFTGLTTPSSSSPCGDWIPFKDESCIILVQRAGLQTKTDAEAVCGAFAEELREEDGPKLISIKTKEKQDFVQKVLFEEPSTFDNVWLGLEVKDETFLWNDGTELFYTNWAEQDSTQKDRGCTQMESGEGSYEAGQWVRVNCQKKNAIVCERTQIWPLVLLRNTLLNIKLESEKHQRESEDNFRNIKMETENSFKTVKQEVEQITNSVQQEANDIITIVKQELNNFKQEATEHIQFITKELQTMKTESDEKIAKLTKALETEKQESQQKLDNLQRNPVPVGFVYVQLPGQQPPSSFWPQVTWTDISSDFAGNFFRVEGGNSAPFGVVQEGACPRLDQVMTMWNKGLVYTATLPVDGTWSNAVHTSFYKGGKEGDDMYSLRFRASTSEVRPRNQAVKVWKRSN